MVGGAVAGVTGEDKNAVTCLDCGASWRPADVFNVIQAVKDATGATLDLSLEAHRLYLERFIPELSPYIDSEISKANDRSSKRTARGKEMGPGYNFSMLAYLVLMIIIFIYYFNTGKSLGDFLAFMVVIFVGLFFFSFAGVSYDLKHGWSPDKANKKTEEEAAAIISIAKENVREQIRLFTKKYPLHRPPLPPPPPRLQ